MNVSKIVKMTENTEYDMSNIMKSAEYFENEKKCLLQFQELVNSKYSHVSMHCKVETYVAIL